MFIIFALIILLILALLIRQANKKQAAEEKLAALEQQMQSGGQDQTLPPQQKQSASQGQQGWEPYPSQPDRPLSWQEQLSLLLEDMRNLEKAIREDDGDDEAGRPGRICAFFHSA
jgi:hypothetical protein